jgi:putative acetyltransferase
MTVTISLEAPDSPDARALIAELDAVLMPMYDVSDRHGYSVDKLKRQRVHFFVIRCDGEAAGCGGVQIFTAKAGSVPSTPSASSVSSVDFGELKRMYVRPRFRGQGLGRTLVDHLIGVVRAHGIDVVRLETGIHQTEAIALYERCGFRRIPPFGDYFESPVSVCYEKRLTS